MAYENLAKKYGIPVEALDKGISSVATGLGKLCNVRVMLAVADLLANGDVAAAPPIFDDEGSK